MITPRKGLSRFEGLVIILGCIFLAFAAFFAWQFARTPLAEPMTVVTVVAPAAPAAPTAADAKAAAVAAAAATAAPTVVAIPVTAGDQEADKKLLGTCGNTGSRLVLFTGEDSSIGVWPKGADAVRVVKIDFDQKKIDVVAFPRDLMVKTGGLANQDIAETALGLAYHYKKEATIGTEKHRVSASTGIVGQALYDNFGIEPVNYVTIQLSSVPAMIDSLGGLEVVVPEAITTADGLEIAAGVQMMNGQTAAEYARDYTKGDASRLQRQNLFVKALQDRVLTTNILPKLPELYEQFSEAIVTDLSPKQIADLACMAREVPRENIAFHEIGGDLVTARDDSVLLPDVEKIKAALKDWLDQ